MFDMSHKRGDLAANLQEECTPTETAQPLPPQPLPLPQPSTIAAPAAPASILHSCEAKCQKKCCKAARWVSRMFRGKTEVM